MLDMIYSATKSLEAAMEAATSYDEWAKAAKAHDDKTGVTKWKKSDESKYFDYKSIRRRLRRLRRLRKSGDLVGILSAQDLLMALE